ncbi:hypothetical protein C5167_033701 [Papaver somniferum]|uniref:Uncharacterized protein n=1 Tax=Papaver somniferum TaxID=3469 RepID=A0A4Y7KE04_PAPSO|nr:hypothetical protein C5167_033701 [Papaver somniferum]
MSLLLDVDWIVPKGHIEGTQWLETWKRGKSINLRVSIVIYASLVTLVYFIIILVLQFFLET